MNDAIPTEQERSDALLKMAIENAKAKQQAEYTRLLAAWDALEAFRLRYGGNESRWGNKISTRAAKAQQLISEIEVLLSTPA